MGICKSLDECKSAEQALYSDKQVFPQTCSIQETIAIVCCTDQKATSDKSPDAMNRDGHFDSATSRTVLTSFSGEKETAVRPNNRTPGVISKQSQ